MSFSERRKYLLIMQRRYKKASRKERAGLLDEMEAVTGLHRKSLIRLMNSSIEIKRKPRSRERGPKYGPEVKYVISSRNRPYHKNDNRFVEQRNGFLVRAYIGYERLDTVEQTILLNKIYQKLWIYHNFFLPVRKTRQKVIVPSKEGVSKVKRLYDEAQPPLERLEESGVVKPEQRMELLKKLHQQTNPLRLREKIYELIEQLFSLPGAKQDVAKDVYKNRCLLNTPCQTGSNWLL